MKFIIFSALALGACATVLDDTPSKVGRDLPTITGVINNVGSKLNALDAAAEAYNGGDATALINAGDALQQATEQGTTQVQATSNLSLSDAVSLQGTVGTLQTSADKLVSDLAAKKPQIEKANLCSQVLNQSTQLNDQSRALINAITSKVPAEAQSIASSLVAGFISALQQNQATWANGNCTNAGGSSASGSSTASSGSSTASSGSSTASSSSASNTASSGATGASSRPTTTGGSGSGSGTGATGATGASGATPSSSIVTTSGATLNVVSWSAFVAAVFAGLLL